MHAWRWAADKTAAQPAGGRGRCPESGWTKGSLQCRARQPHHLTAARYALGVALDAVTAPDPQG